MQTVSDLIGLPINYLITVNFRGFKQIVNRLGGVWIDVDRRYFNDNAGLSADVRLREDQPAARLPAADRRQRARLRALPAHRLRPLPRRPSAAVREGDEVPARAQLLASVKVPKIVGTLTKNIEVAAGGGGGVSRQDDPQLRPLRLSPAVGPLLPDADPGADRLLRPEHRLVEHHRRPSRTGERRTSRRPTDATNVALGRKVKQRTPTPAADDDHRPERQRCRRLGRRRGLPASRNVGYQIVPPPANATGNAPSFDYFHTSDLLEPAVKRSAAAANGGREAVRAGRRRRRSHRRSPPLGRTARC